MAKGIVGIPAPIDSKRLIQMHNNVIRQFTISMIFYSFHEIKCIIVKFIPLSKCSKVIITHWFSPFTNSSEGRKKRDGGGEAGGESGKGRGTGEGLVRDQVTQSWAGLPAAI